MRCVVPIARRFFESRCLWPSASEKTRVYKRYAHGYWEHSVRLIYMHVQLTKKKSAGYTVRELEELKQVIDRSVESNCGKSQDCDACSAKRTIISLCRVIAILKMLCCFQFVWGIKMDILLGRIISWKFHRHPPSWRRDPVTFKKLLVFEK